MPMQAKAALEHTISVLLVGCALAMTAMAASSRFSRPPDPSQPSSVPDWQKFAVGQKRIGPSNAAVTIVEFSDFQCPFCVQLYHAVEKARLRYPTDIAIVFRNFPIAHLHPFARGAALAAECAATAGRFEPYHDYLFENQDSIGVVDWTTIAQRVRIADSTAFSECLQAESTVAHVRVDSIAALALDLTGTPTVLVNEWRIQGVPKEAELDSLIVNEIRLARRRSR